jgi:hypothetical protein
LTKKTLGFSSRNYGLETSIKICASWKIKLSFDTNHHYPVVNQVGLSLDPDPSIKVKSSFDPVTFVPKQ